MSFTASRLSKCFYGASLAGIHKFRYDMGMRKLFLFIILLGLAAGAVFAYPATTARTEPKEKPLSLAKLAFHFIADTSAPLKGQERDRINILFLGMSGVPHPAPFLTDTIILMSIKPSTHQLGLLSLPRDLLVKTANGGQTKINSLYLMNKKDPALAMEKVSEITGQPIDYYFTFDIGGVETIVDTLGGLNVLVPEDVNDPAFPSDNGGTEKFSVEKGWRYFDGATVQKYLRTRHSQGGDFARMRQQQAVVEALRKKIFGMHMLYDFPTLFSLYRELTPHIQSDIDESGIQQLYTIAKNISYDTVQHVTIDGDPRDAVALLKSKTITLSGIPAFVLVPKTGDFDYYGIADAAANIFNESGITN